MNAPTRRHSVQDITTVRHVCTPFGRNTTNPPSLGQLREFVEACQGLPDDTAVSIERSSLSESGRYTYVLGVRIVAEGDVTDDAEQPQTAPLQDGDLGAATDTTAATHGDETTEADRL